MWDPKSVHGSYVTRYPSASVTRGTLPDPTTDPASSAPDARCLNLAWARQAYKCLNLT